MKKYIVFVTPKAYSKLPTTLPDPVNNDFDIEPTSWIYMNMEDGWTKKECDNVAYICERASFNTLDLEFKP